MADLGIVSFLSQRQFFLSKISVYLTFIIFFVVVGIIFFFWLYLLSYNIKILIVDERGGASKIRYDRARRVREDNVYKLKLLWNKADPIKLPFTSQVYIKGKKDFIFLNRMFDGSFKYLEKEQSPSNKLISENSPDSRFWETLTMRKIRERYHGQNFWEKWGNIIIQGGYIVFLFMIFIILFKEMEGITTGLNSVAGSIGAACSSPSSIPIVP